MWNAVVEKLSLKCPVAESVPSNLPNASSCAGQYRKCVCFLFSSGVWSVLKESSKIHLERQKLFLIWLQLLLLSLLYPLLGRWRLAIILPIRYLWHRGFMSSLPDSWGRYCLIKLFQRCSTAHFFKSSLVCFEIPQWGSFSRKLY